MTVMHYEKEIAIESDATFLVDLDSLAIIVLKCWKNLYLREGWLYSIFCFHSAEYKHPSTAELTNKLYLETQGAFLIGSM